MVYPCGQICLQPVNFFGAELAETLHHQTNETDRNAGTENASREPVWVEPCGTPLRCRDHQNQSRGGHMNSRMIAIAALVLVVIVILAIWVF